MCIEQEVALTQKHTHTSRRNLRAGYTAKSRPACWRTTTNTVVPNTAASPHQHHRLKYLLTNNNKQSSESNPMCVCVCVHYAHVWIWHWLIVFTLTGHNKYISATIWADGTHFANSPDASRFSLAWTWTWWSDLKYVRSLNTLNARVAFQWVHCHTQCAEVEFREAPATSFSVYRKRVAHRSVCKLFAPWTKTSVVFIGVTIASFLWSGRSCLFYYYFIGV